MSNNVVIQHTGFKRGPRGNGKKHCEYIGGSGKYSDKEDVIYIEDGNLPTWAKTAVDFFDAADQFERNDYTKKVRSKDGMIYNKQYKARAYIEFEWSVPRGIKDPVKWCQMIAHKTLGNLFTYRLAVHDAPASDGGRNINMHLMFSDRRLDGIERDTEHFFRRAKTGCYRHRKTGELIPHSPEDGGTRKDRFWNQKIRPKWARDLFEEYVRHEIPSFRLVKSANPEPKIGPRLKESSACYEELRQAVQSTVLRMRAIRRELQDIESELQEQTKLDAAISFQKTDVDRQWEKFQDLVTALATRHQTIPRQLLEATIRALEPQFQELNRHAIKNAWSPNDLAALIIRELELAHTESATPDNTPEHIVHDSQSDVDITPTP